MPHRLDAAPPQHRSHLDGVFTSEMKCLMKSCLSLSCGSKEDGPSPSGFPGSSFLKDSSQVLVPPLGKPHGKGHGCQGLTGPADPADLGQSTITLPPSLGMGVGNRCSLVN